MPPKSIAALRKASIQLTRSSRWYPSMPANSGCRGQQRDDSAVRQAKEKPRATEMTD